MNHGTSFLFDVASLHFISAVGIISLWRPAFLFYVGSLFSADFVFLGSPGLHFIWLDSLLSSEIFSVGASSGLHFLLPHRACGIVDISSGQIDIFFGIVVRPSFSFRIVVWPIFLCHGDFSLRSSLSFIFFRLGVFFRLYCCRRHFLRAKLTFSSGSLSDLHFLWDRRWPIFLWPWRHFL